MLQGITLVAMRTKLVIQRIKSGIELFIIAEVVNKMNYECRSEFVIVFI